MPVVIEGGIFAVMDVGIPAAIDTGIPIAMVLAAIMGLAGGLTGVTWGGELKLRPPKFWANKLMGATPAQTQGKISQYCFRGLPVGPRWLLTRTGGGSHRRDSTHN